MRQQPRRSVVAVLSITIAALVLLADVVQAQATIKATRVQPPDADRVEQHLDLVYARYGDRAMHLDLFQPKGANEPLPAVVVVHGGGWAKGDKTRFRALAVALAERGYVTAAIEYRLADEAKFPAAVHDCNAAVRWLRTEADRYGIDPTKIAAVGGSAGGHLVGLVAAAGDARSLQGSGSLDQSSGVQAAVVMAGPFELKAGPLAERWLGKSLAQAPELYQFASPLRHLSPDTPPILFQHGEFDKPELNQSARRRLDEHGVANELKIYAAGRHGCWNQHPWFGPMVDDIDAFLTAKLKRESKPEWLRREKTEWGELRFAAAGLELHVTSRPESGTLHIPRLNNEVTAVYLAGDDTKKPLALSPGVTEWTITLPSAPKEGDGPLVVVVETVGRPYVPVLPRIATAGANGSIVLAAHDAVTHGENLRYEPQPHKNTVGYWSRKEDTCRWQFYLDQPGAYAVHVLQGCGKGHGGSEVLVAIGDQQVAFTVEDTGHFQNFKDREIGTVELKAPQVYTLELRPQTKVAGAVMDVRQVRLARVAAKPNE